MISGGERHCRLVGLDDQSLINPDHHVLNLATLTWTTFSRETECRQWQLRSVEMSVLERCRVKDFTSIPDSNQLKEALVSGPEDLCFQIDHGNLDTVMAERAQPRSVRDRHAPGTNRDLREQS